jgi:Flp pilus assembly protein TadD
MTKSAYHAGAVALAAFLSILGASASTRPLRADDDRISRSRIRGLDGPSAAESQKPVDFSSPSAEIRRHAPEAPRSGIAYSSSITLLTAAPPAQPLSSGTDDAAVADPGSPSPSTRALDRVQVMGLVAGGVSSRRVARLVTDRGITFQPDDKYLADLRSAGATDDLINALRAAKSETAPEQTADNDGLQLQECMTRGAELARALRFAEAEEEYRKAERLRPQDSSVHFALGYALSQEAKWSQAASEYRAAIANDPNNAAAHADLGVAMAKAGDVDGAMAEYRRALAIDPEWSALHNNLGVALKQKGDLGGARTEFCQALAENPEDPQIHTNLGSVLQQQGDLNGAIREYRQALGLEGNCCQAQYNLATALEARGDVDGAIAGFQAVLKVKPDDARAHAGLASALERKGHSAEALRQYERALSLAPNDAEIRAGHDALVKRIQSVADSSSGGPGH